MEGYYWRFCRRPPRAAHRRAVRRLPRARRPVGASSRSPRTPAASCAGSNAARAWADPDGLGVAACERRRRARCCAAPSAGSWSTSAPDARLEAVLEGRAEWPRRALGGLGLAQAAPGLPQYWHPHLLGARVRGEARLGGETVDARRLRRPTREKNWGGAFPGDWWWGQAGFGDGAMAAFAGGRLRGPLRRERARRPRGRRGRRARAAGARS